MTFFGLDPQSIAERAHAAAPAHVSTCGKSVLRGTIGFTLLGLAGFAPWAMGLSRALGEGGMYSACAIVFVVLSGPLLHRLVIGPHSLARFYKLFTLAYVSYAVIWCAVWFGLPFKGNDYLGLALGTAAFGWIVASAFGARGAALKIIAVLIVLHALGYALGGWLYSIYKAHSLFEFIGVMLDSPTRSTTARLLWGFGYGLGFGAGIGYAFHVCQEEARALIAASPTTQNPIAK
ncbi:MAG TPA: hypothetical protein VI454_12800 [Verrucomicrobiae bacterium]|jgi:hypothetical protein